MSPEIRVPKAAKMCLSAPVVRLSSSNEHARETCGYSPNSFYEYFIDGTSANLPSTHSAE